MRRYILTGAPGAGKTTLLHALAARGHLVVAEAATDVIATRQAQGVMEPWMEDHFVAAITTLQRERQAAVDSDAVELCLFDRSPICTLSLAKFLGRRVPPRLSEELDRIRVERIYESDVLFIQSLPFMTPTAARRISLEDALIFEEVHRQTYLGLGYRLIMIPPVDIARRIEQIEQIERVVLAAP